MVRKMCWLYDTIGRMVLRLARLIDAAKTRSKTFSVSLLGSGVYVRMVVRAYLVWGVRSVWIVRESLAWSHELLCSDFSPKRLHEAKYYMMSALKRAMLFLNDCFCAGARTHALVLARFHGEFYPSNPTPGNSVPERTSTIDNNVFTSLPSVATLGNTNFGKRLACAWVLGKKEGNAYENYWLWQDFVSQHSLFWGFHFYFCADLIIFTLLWLTRIRCFMITPRSNFHMHVYSQCAFNKPCTHTPRFWLHK